MKIRLGNYLKKSSLRRPGRRSAGLLAPVLLMLLGFCAPLRAQEVPPTTCVQIINATSVPMVSLRVNGENYYPEFPQGLYTADAPNPILNARYKVTDGTSRLSAEKEVAYEADAHQSVLLIGDFSTGQPAAEFPQPDQVPVPGSKPFPPNVHFRVYKHDEGTAGGISYRVTSVPEPATALLGLLGLGALAAGRRRRG